MVFFSPSPEAIERGWWLYHQPLKIKQEVVISPDITGWQVIPLGRDLNKNYRRSFLIYNTSEIITEILEGDVPNFMSRRRGLQEDENNFNVVDGLDRSVALRRLPLE